LGGKEANARGCDGTVPEKSALTVRNIPEVTIIGPLESEHTELTWDPKFLEKLREILGVKANAVRRNP